MRIVEAREVPVGEKCLWLGDEWRRIEGEGPEGDPLFNLLGDDGTPCTWDTPDDERAVIAAIAGQQLVHLFDIAEAA